MNQFINEGNSFISLLQEKKNFVFIGEAGSGKSEIALNIAAYFAGRKVVHFFDLDQSKPLFRSRDLKEEFEGKRIIFHHNQDNVDAPVLSDGIISYLLDDNCVTILDIGGGDAAARMIGGFAHIINKDNSAAVYVVNPYRAWSGSEAAIAVTMSSIMIATRIRKLYVLGNPALGPETTKEEVIEGCRMLDDLLSQHMEINGVCVRSEIAEEIQKEIQTQVFPIKLYLTYPWERQ